MAGADQQQPHWPTRVKRPGERRNMSRSATRALDVLEFFGHARRPLRAIDIARSLDLHPSSVDQLLKTMVDSAHLTFEAVSKTYLPSPRLARFGGWLVETYGGDERLRSLIQRVRAASGEVVTLTTPNDIYMQVVDLSQADAEGAERGLRVSMFGSAIGAAYLSTLPDAEVLRLAFRARLPETENAALIAWVARIRQNGFADGPSAEGSIWSIATPLPAAGSRAPLVLGLAGQAENVRARLGELGTLLKSAVAEIRA